MYIIDIKKCISDYTGLEEVKLSVPPGKLEGDISTNAAMAAGMDAGRLLKRIQQLPCVEKAQSAGPGFINITLTMEALRQEVREIVSSPAEYARSEEKKKVLFEMVSSNPTGPLHIGHGRGAAIGDSLARMYERLGYEVYREYYVNNTGRQMKILGESIFNTAKGLDIPDCGYKGSYIKEIADDLKGCEDSRQCAEKASQKILKKHLDVLKNFGVEYDDVFYESWLFSRDEVDDIVRILAEKGLIFEKDGASWFKSTLYGDDTDRVLKKSDGEYTYFASDCAYHRNKASRFDKIINIWGEDHHGYVPRIKAFWKAMGYDKDAQLDVMLYKLVDLKRGSRKISMSTREGEYVTLEEVIGEVGSDASRFFMLMRSSDAKLEFDLELAKKEDKTNPVYYVQYSHARICSVFSKKGIKPEDIGPEAATMLDAEEKNVIKTISRFPYVLEKCVRLSAPHFMTEYLREVAVGFHKYYDTVRILDTEKEEARLLLLKAVKNIIANGLELVGVSAPERM